MLSLVDIARGLVILSLGLLPACTSPGDDASASTVPDTATTPEPQAIVTESAPADSAQTVPHVALPALGGGSFRPAEHQGEVLLVNFWATWCAPCVAEMPDLAALHRDFHPLGLTVVGISMDEGGLETVKPFAQKRDLPYPLVAGNEEVAEQFGGVYGLPTTFVVDQEGRIVQRVVGLFPVEDMRPALRSMLGRSEKSSQGDSTQRRGQM